jgi:hypothetical protein
MTLNRLILLHLLLFPAISFSQEFGGNPSTVKWQQINSEAVRVIFQPQNDSIARRVASLINLLNANSSRVLGTQHRKVSLILQPQTTVSNAYVALAPFKSEFFLTPSQNNFEAGSLPWPDQLAVHEFRHVQQYNNFNVGLSHVLHIIFGQGGQALGNSAAIPNWFFEGDAVYNETAVTMQGRGRLPYFFKDYKALWLANRRYSWMKLRNGSYKDYIPNHYPLGYMLTAYGYNKYGENFWANVTKDAASFKGLFYPFQQAIKKYSGVSYKQFRNDALNYFRSQLITTPKASTGRNTGPFRSYEYPAYISDNDLIVIKSGFKEVPKFIEIKNGKERVLRTSDITLDNAFSYNAGWIAYTSYHPDARWGYRDYSNIKMINVATGEERRVTSATKYFAPSVSAEGSKIVAVQITPAGESKLHLLNTADGKIEKEIGSPAHFFYTYPKFFSAEKIITALRDTTGRMSIAMIDIATGSYELLTPPSFNVIAFPAIQGDTVYYTSSYGKEDRMFALKVSDKSVYLLSLPETREGTGYYYPAPGLSQLSWSSFTDKGYKLSTVNKSEIHWQRVSNDDIVNNRTNFGIQSLDAATPIIPAPVPQFGGNATRYHSASGLLNFHSIEPDVNDPEYRLYLLGENILSTMRTQVYVGYDRSERSKEAGADIVYAGLYPVLSVGAEYIKDRNTLYQNKVIYWDETELHASVNVPLNLTRGKYYRFFNIGSTIAYNTTRFQNIAIPKERYSYLSSFVTFDNQMQQAVQHIYPHLAQSLLLQYKNGISTYTAQQFLAIGNLYFPGALKNHSTQLNGAYFIKDTLGELNLSSGFPFSRGYNSYNFHEMFKWGGEYHFTVAYPDFGIGHIVYFSRIRDAVFYDETRANDYFSGRPYSFTFRSVGSELFFDTKWWNQASVSFGIRYSYLMDQDVFTNARNRWEFILPVNLFQR